MVGGDQDCSRQRVLRVDLNARRPLQDVLALKAGRGENLGQRGLAVGEGSGFVEDERATGGDLLERRRIFDDDAVAGGK